MAKKKGKKKTTTVNVDEVRRDWKKAAKSMVDNTPAPEGHQVVAPGTIKRESPLEQEMGTAKYKQMIHDHNDKNKHILDRLPFTFPKKKVVRSHLNIQVNCPDCGHEHWGSENTVGYICPQCKKFVKVTNPEAESRGYDPDLRVGIFGSATDRLNLKEEKKKKKS
jgi:DNA-directed RNA polymerase subunit RPC12/RpoP